MSSYWQRHFKVRMRLEDGSEIERHVSTDGFRPTEGKKVDGPFGKGGVLATVKILSVRERQLIPDVVVIGGPVFTDNPLW